VQSGGAAKRGREKRRSLRGNGRGRPRLRGDDVSENPQTRFQTAFGLTEKNRVRGLRHTPYLWAEAV